MTKIHGALFALGLMLAGPATAATVLQFDELTWARDPSLPLSEGDYQVTGTPMIGGVGALDVDIALGPFSDTYHVARTDGGLFSWLSLDVLPIGSTYQFPNNPQTDLIISGYLGGVLQGQTGGTSQNGAQIISATSGFGTIDLLEITGQMTPNALYMMDLIGYDVHFHIDNIALDAVPSPSPVPLPAGIGLLAGGLACLGLTRRPRRRT